MASPFHLPVTAAQVGTYFVGQYYQVLQQQPELVHQFYSDASTVVRVDRNTRETASAMLQIHKLVMSLNYTGIEIKTAHSLESWNGGVLVMVSGSVHINDLHNRRKFVQTFFLAPQEKGYFVLNDIFHYIEDDEPIHQHLPVAYLPQTSLDSEFNSTIIQEPVSNYIQSRDFIGSKIEENGVVDHYSLPDQERLKQVPEAEQIIEDNFQEVVHSNGGSIQNSMNPVQEHHSVPVEEPVVEPPKHTYASILQVAKGQYLPTVTPQPSFNKTTTTPSEWNQVADPTPQQFIPPLSTTVEQNGVVEDSSAVEEDSVEFKSVYVKNVPPTASSFEIEEEFKKFGKIKPDGVAIRTRKDIDVCYAFVEFEDIIGVQNAIKASSVEVGGQQVYIEGRRPNRNSSNTFRGGRGRGRGRNSSYQMEGRGRFGSHRANGTGGEERGDNNRPSRGRNYDNDNNTNKIFYRQITLQQDRLYSNRHQFGMNRNGASSN